MSRLLESLHVSCPKHSRLAYLGTSLSSCIIVLNSYRLPRLPVCAAVCTVVPYLETATPLHCRLLKNYSVR
jgi:hypothetical protein